MHLQTRDLHVSYGQVEVLRGITLELPDRGVTALTGPSGCGKSTFLRSLNRLHDLDPEVRIRGKILLDGIDVSRLAPECLRRQVGMVFQRPNPFPATIFANVAFGPRIWGVREAELPRLVRNSLERAALWSEVRTRLQADARSLSGGQQQRLCIARALALLPGVLLMDEPCSALDPSSSQSINDLIGELKRSIAVVLVTHNPDQVRQVADQEVRFERGKIR